MVTGPNQLKLNQNVLISLIPPEIVEKDSTNINVLELFPVFEGLSRWKNTFSCHKVTFVVDNLQVFYMIRTCRSINETCMKWLREIFWISAYNDIELSSEYIRSEDNVAADTLSRLGYENTRLNVQSLLMEYRICCKWLLNHYCRSQASKVEEKVPQPPNPGFSPINVAYEEDTGEMLPSVL